MRALALLIVVGCSTGGEPNGEPVTKPSGGSSQGGTASSSAGGGEAGAGLEASPGGAGAGGVADGGEAGSSSGAPAAGTGGTTPVDACPEVEACTEKCTLMVPGKVLPGNRCALGSFSCGETLGYYASDGKEWTFVTETAAAISIEAGNYCRGN